MKIVIQVHSVGFSFASYMIIIRVVVGIVEDFIQVSVRRLKSLARVKVLAGRVLISLALASLLSAIVRVVFRVVAPDAVAEVLHEIWS